MVWSSAAVLRYVIDTKWNFPSNSLMGSVFVPGKGMSSTTSSISAMERSSESSSDMAPISFEKRCLKVRPQSESSPSKMRNVNCELAWLYEIRFSWCLLRSSSVISSLLAKGFSEFTAATTFCVVNCTVSMSGRSGT